MLIKENWRGFITLVRREVMRVLRIWPQTLVPSAITMTLYFIIFGDIMGQRIGNMNGVPYMQYIVPGLMMLAIITNTFINVSSSVFSSKFQRNLEELLVSPMSNHAIIWGYAGGGIIRGIMVAIIVAIVSLFFGKISMYNWLISISIIMLTAILFSLAGFINGILAKKFDDISFIPTFALTPLSYLGGIFYSVDLLPSFWQNVSHFNPIFYMVNGFRWGLLGTADVAINYALGILVAAVVICYGCSWWLMQRGIGVKS